jgi:hypothetical protein
MTIISRHTIPRIQLYLQVKIEDHAEEGREGYHIPGRVSVEGKEADLDPSYTFVFGHLHLLHVRPSDSPATKLSPYTVMSSTGLCPLLLASKCF